MNVLISKRSHKTYPETQKKNILQFHKDMGDKLPLTASCYNGIPPSTIRTWIKQEASRKQLRRVSILQTIAFIPLLIVTALGGVVGMAMLICYLTGGPEEAHFMWESLSSLIR